MLISNILRAIFFPRKCLGCGTQATAGPACPRCSAGLERNRTLFCGECRARLPGTAKICHPACPYLLGAAGNYEGPLLRKLIHALKFARCREVAPVLGALLAEYASRIPLDLSSYAVIPIPLSKRRERERGFNQSELIAQAFMKHFSSPFRGRAGGGLVSRSDLILRSRHTPPQSGTKDERERANNVRDAFAVVPNATVPKNILLIDDVTTSGATFREAALALKTAGARHILALACAKA